MASRFTARVRRESQSGRGIFDAEPQLLSYYPEPSGLRTCGRSNWDDLFFKHRFAVLTLICCELVQLCLVVRCASVHSFYR